MPISGNGLQRPAARHRTRGFPHGAMLMNVKLSQTVLVACLFCLSPMPSVFSDDASVLKLSVSDEAGRALPCRVHLFDAQGEPRLAADLPAWKDHFVCPGHASLTLEPGDYRYEIERGPEYQRVSGRITVAADRNADVSHVLRRLIRLRDTNWYSADLHVHRPVKDIQLLMQAEDLNFAPVITWWNSRNAWQDDEPPQQTTVRVNDHCIYNVMAGEDEREGGALLYFGLQKPLNIRSAAREFPSPVRFVEQARQANQNVWIDIEKPFWWDVPVWLATEQMNSIGVANNHMCRSRMYLDEAWGRPRDVTRLPNPRGNGFWTQEIYYHILNSGLRIPPSAGSASGVLPNPVGYNRVYVHLDEEFSREAMYRGIARGESFVTNGPILQVTADGERPGAIFRLANGEARRMHLKISTLSSDPLAQLEIIHNGTVAHTINCTGELAEEHSVELSADQPGWLLVRAIADVDHTFRFASTAPWYVETTQQPHRISKRSAEFFLQWVDERTERVKANIADDFERAEVLLWHDRARDFWEKRLQSANAE